MSRRRFVERGSAGVLGLAGVGLPGSRLAEVSAQSPALAAPPAGFVDGVDTRVHDVLQAYDSQGIHRTGTDVDRASGEWLRDQASRAGATASVRGFTLDRLDVREAFVEVNGQRIDGLPFFDAGTTPPPGVAAPVGPRGVLVVTADSTAIATEGEFLAGPRREAQAVVVLTAGGQPGLVPSNARRFGEPYGCPVLQVAASPARDLLAAAASSGAAVRVVCDATRTSATALNVVAEVPGRDRGLAPVVVITPRSGWWRCASERGGGIACWIEALRAAAAAGLPRSLLALASSGHELGHLGLDQFLHAEAALVKGARAWVHLGANIGAGPAGSIAGVRIQASDDELASAMSQALGSSGARIADHLPRGRVPAGEARNLHLGGARYVSVLGQGNPWFHHEGDRFPAAVGAAEVARYARGIAQCVAGLARM